MPSIKFKHLNSSLRIIILFCFFPLLLQGQCERIFSFPVPQRYFQVDSVFSKTEKDTLSINQILECKAEALAQKDYGTAVYLDLRRYIISRETGFHSSEMSALLEDMLGRALKLKDPYLLVSIYMQRAWYNMQYSSLSAGLLDYLRSYEILKTLSQKTFPGKNYPLYSIALIFYQYNDYAKALEIAGQIEKPIDDPFHHTLSSNLVGMCYLKTEKYDSARYWFSEAMNLNIGRPDWLLAWEGITDGNIGYTWYLQHEYDKAIPFLLSGVEKTAATDIVDNTAGFQCILADIYLSKGQPEVAYRYLEGARINSYRARTNDNYYKLYAALSRYFRQTGDPVRTLMYQDSMLFFQDKLEVEWDDNQKVQAEYKFANEKWYDESAKLMAATRYQKGIRNLVLGILFLLMIVSLLLYNRQRMKHIFKERQSSLEQKQTKEELTAAQIQLDDFTRSLLEKNALLDQFSQEMEKLHSQQDISLSTEQSQILDQLRISAILTDEHWEDFRERFEKVHGGYLQRLRSKLPDLSPAEIRFMALAKLQLTNKEMSGILGVSPDSIRMMRHRLRRKLNLDEEGSLEEMINSI